MLTQNINTMVFLNSDHPVLEQVEQFAKFRKLHHPPIMQPLVVKNHIGFLIQQHALQPPSEAISSCLFTKIH